MSVTAMMCTSSCSLQLCCCSKLVGVSGLCHLCGQPLGPCCYAQGAIPGPTGGNRQYSTSRGAQWHPRQMLYSLIPLVGGGVCPPLKRNSRGPGGGNKSSYKPDTPNKFAINTLGGCSYSVGWQALLRQAWCGPLLHCTICLPPPPPPPCTPRPTLYAGNWPRLEHVSGIR